ncbi:preprotein translocase subunit SecG [Azospirillum fermentarium]|uniref:preprotein translocase subunit SecG n=1 Tax=Azospirillum fermentarium TaxID=1233114 RepID=UPI0022266499|nr:preprotein translocase subunit SecG [Azospirillum fermentarium]MCW2245949.1 preprotein translocase subunit SecG [Azospirillum fermentarium]
MHAVVLVIHLLIALALVGVILIQKSEGGGLGIGGGTMGGMMSARGTANLLTRTTAILAACFMATSIVLAVMAGNTGAQRPASIIDSIPAQPVAPAAPAAPAQPAPPVAQ